MENEAKVHQKIRNFLNSILYPEDNIARRVTGIDLQTEPTQVPRRRNIQEQRPAALNAIKGYWPVIIISIVLILAVALFIVKDSERQKNIKLEYALTEVIKTKEDIEQEFTELQQETKEKAIRDAFELAKHQALLSGSKERIEELLSGFRKERAVRVGLEEQVDDVKELLLSVMKAKGDLEKKLMERDARKKQINIEGITVRTGPIVKGNISIVNVEDNFVVVDLGNKDRLAPGLTLAVHRNNRFIGRLLVILVDERVSIATILPAWRDIGIVEEGDIVRTL